MMNIPVQKSKSTAAISFGKILRYVLPALLLLATTASAQTGPAGVNTGIGAWWRADAGASGTSWTDQSGNNRTLAQGAAGSKPAFITTGINFNPTLDFDGNDLMSSATVLGTGSTQNVAIFAVAQPEDNNTGRLAAEYTSNGFFVGIHFPYNGDARFYWDAPYGYRISGAWGGTLGNPYVVSTTKTPTAMYAYSNHKVIASSTGQAYTCVCPGNNSSFTVGGFADAYFGGKVSEMIVYKNSAALTATDRQKIESYLALKYGITLDQTTPYNYIASDGTIMWNAGTNATWNKNITGIGRDNTSSLHQKQSRTALAANRIFSIAVGNSLPATNTANGGAITTDKTFLVFGDNGGSTLINNITTANASIEKIMARTWRVQKSAAWADQNVTMNAGVNYANKYIVISNTSSSFVSISNIVQLDGTGTGTFNSSLLPDGAYFTIGQAPTGPGGVVGNLRVWMDANKGLYADAGITPATDGAHVDQWADQSQTLTGSASYSTGSNGGTAIYRANGLNYNGALELTNVALRGFTNTQITSPNISSFMAVNSTATNSGHRYYVLYSNASGGYDYNINQESIVFGLNGVNLQSHRTGWENPTQPALVGKPMVATSLTTATTHTLNVNGKDGISAAYVKGTFAIDQYFIGGSYAAGWCCGSSTENYGEIVTYDRALTTVETRKVESYMALKYGISIDQTIAKDYVASNWNGTTGTKMWVNDNDAYTKKIFGIGRDDAGQLYQKQSTAADTANIFGIATGTSFPNTNAANTAAIATDKTFLTFATNGLGTKFSVTITGGTSTQRMPRIWKVDKSAAWASASITLQTIGSTAKYLIVNASDPTFAAGNIEYQLDGNGQVTINSDVLANNAYVTFGNKMTGPAGVTAGIAVWMDARTTASGNMTAGTGWQDQSGNGRDFRGVSSDPARIDAGLNFNRYINFDGDDYVRNIDGAFASNIFTQGEVFTVTKSNGVFNGQGYPYDFGSNSRGNHLRWGDASDYNGFGTTDRIGYNPVTNGVTDTKPGVTVTGRGYDPGNWIIHSTYSAPGSWGAAYNGLFKAATNTNTVGFYSPDKELIGAFSSAVYNGNVAEVVLYNRKLTAAERLQVWSYLGLKYGLTVDQTVAQNYMASDGTTVMWRNDLDGYNQRITGLGRDNATYLHQKMGTNQDTGTIWTLSLGNTLTGLDNFNNPNTVSTDKTFFTFADNNAVSQYLTNVIGTNVNVRMNRTWKVDKSAAWNDQSVIFNAGAAYANKYLLVSSTANFATLTQELPLDANGSVVLNTSALPDNTFFTIGNKIIGPAGNNIGIAAWWRADNNATSAVWNDYSGNDRTAAQGAGANQPVVNPNAFNYNPGMTFDGANDYMIAPSLFAGGLNNALIFLVSGAKVLQSNIAFSEYANNASYLENLNIWADNAVYFDAPYGYRISGASGAKLNTPYIWTMQRTPTAMNIWRNKTNIATATSTFGNYSGAGNFYIGNRQDLAYSYNGNIAELVVYNNGTGMSANQKRAVETYLSVKYGTSLDSVQGNYLAYDSTVLWDQTTNAGNRWRVTGIGRDDRSGLNQKQSRNYDTLSQGYVAVGLSTLEQDNITNTATFGTDKSYLIWGDNNGAGITATTLAGATVNPANPTLFNGLSGCAAIARFTKVFRVQKTGSVGAVQVRVNTTGLNVGKSAADYYLAINNTNAFNSGTVQQLVAATAYNTVTRIVTFDNVTFNTGDYFTIVGKKVQAPANIVTGIKLWLKAEDGITADSASKVKAWDDQSPANNNVTGPVALASQPAYNSTNTLLNFNPTVTFNGASVMTAASILKNNAYTGSAAFYTGTQTGLNNSAIFTEALGVGGQFNLHATWSDNVVYWDGPSGPARLTYATGGILNKPYLWSVTSNPGRQIIYQNGKNVATSTTASSFTGNSSPFVMGNAYYGRMGELIIYTAPLAALDVQKINSYLSVKWGLSLDQTVAQDYVSSDGSAIWNGTTNTAFKYRVTGIGRDDCSDLNQLQSRNQDTTVKGYVTMGRGLVAASNAGNASTFGNDKSFLLWGDDNTTGISSTSITGDATTTITGASCTQLRRTTKVFKVAATNTPGALQVQFNVTGMALGKKPADFFLAINNTNSFATGTVAKVVPASTYINGVVTFDNVTFTDGQYFTLVGQKSGAPANVSAGIATWLKAEDGINLNGSTVSLWEDQSAGARNAAQVTAAYQPVYNAATPNTNFNPSLTTTGTQMLVFNSSIQQSNMKIFAVGTPLVATGLHRTLLRGAPTTEDHQIIINAGSALYGYWNNRTTPVAGFNTSGQSTNGQPQLFGMALNYPGTGTVQTAQPSLNGKNGTLINNISNAGVADQLMSYANGQAWGTLSEIVIYNSSMSLTDQLKVQSYLALKYGITLDQTVATNYVASDNSVIWDATVNTAYKNHITGLGRDDCSDFEQKQSRNVDTTSPGFATMAIGDLFTDNETNPNHITADKSFLMWGDDNVAGMTTVAITGDAATTLPVDGNCTQFRRLAKTYKVQKSGTGIDGVQVQLNARTLTFGGSTAGVYLAVNSSSNFAGTVSKLVPASDFTNNVYSFDHVTFSNGDYFTLVGPAAKAPANIQTGLAAWYRSDDANSVVLSGAAITNWNDQSGSDNNLDYVLGTPAYNTSGAKLINFNPTVSKPAGAYLATLKTVIGSSNNLAVFTVARQTAGNWTWGHYATNANWIEGGQNLAGTAYFDAPYGYRTSGAALAPLGNSSALMTYVKTPTTMTIFTNKKQTATTAAAYGDYPGLLTAGHGLFIGGGADATFVGEIGEVIVYNNAATMTAAQRQAIESYLAIKWGITLDQTVATNYLSADATPIWDGTANAAYKNRITGLGRDDCSSLTQKQSRNQDTTSPGYVTMGLGSVATSNAANTSAFSVDKSFEIWGDDGLTGIGTTGVTGDGTISLMTGSCPLYSRLAKTFKVQETGTVGAVQVQINTTGATLGKTAADFYLGINNSAAFTGTITKLIPASSLNNGLVTFDNVDFTDGQYFTVIGKKVQGPGSVTGNLKLWIKAEDGVTVNGTSVTGWDDQGPQGNALVTAGGTGMTYNTSGQNFNPVINFPGGALNNFLVKALGGGILGTSAYTSATVFAVSKPANTTQTIRIIDEATATGGGFYMHLPYSGAIYSDLPVNARLSVATPANTTTQFNVWNMNSAAAAQSIYQNGKSLASGVLTGTTVNYNGNNSAFRLGSSLGTADYAGNMAEVIIYTQAVTAGERQKINSYLSLKWGITQDQTTPTSYYAADWNGTSGTTIWDAAANTAYKNRITGIGRDDCSDLNQLQSRNQDTLAAGYVTMGLGEIATSNAANGNTFSADKSFEMWADDGVTGLSSTTVSGDGTITLAGGACPLYSRLGKTFKVQETGTVGGLQVQVSLNGAAVSKTAADLYLAINGTSTFAGTVSKLVPATSLTNGIATFDNVDFTNGQFFTIIGKKVLAPANVTNGAQLWLKADNGITLNGTNVSTWEDQSAGSNHAAQSVAGSQATYMPAAINFNPALNFDGVSDYMDIANGLGLSSTASDYTMLGVSSRNTVGTVDAILGQQSSATNSALFYFNATNNWMSGKTNGTTLASTGTYNTPGIPMFNTATRAVNTISLYSNGKADGTGTIAGGFLDANARIGNRATTADAAFNGKIGEVIMYNRALDAGELQKIHSYLGIKYGLTYNAGASDYLASNASIIWAANATYKNRITGIGRDDCSDLQQRQSRNQDTLAPGFVTMALGGVALSNDSNANNFQADKSFLMWADDGIAGKSISTITGDGNLAIANGAPCANYVRMAKTFQVQRTNFTDPVQVQVNLNGMTIGKSLSDYYLALNTNASITGTVTKLIPATAVNNGVVTFNNVDFTAGSYFTVIGQKVQSPANIQASNLKVWLKADDGVINDGAKVSEWDDNSPALNNVAQVTLANQPAYSTTTNLINFNPSVNFTGNTPLVAPSILGTGTYSGATAFYAGSPTAAGAGSVFQESLGVGSQLNLHAPYSDNIVYWDAPGTSRITYSNGAVTTTPLLWTGFSDPTVATGIRQAIYKNGQQVATGNTTGAYTGNNSAFTIGLSAFNARVGEVIVYTAPLTFAERMKINSYLAIKWGISIDQTVPTDYLSSAGDTIWNKANATYKYRITGIGVDSCFDLKQRQSRNQATGSVLTFGLGNIAASNAANTNEFTGGDKNYVVTGDDNGVVTQIGTNLPAYAVSGTKRIARTWKAQATGTPPANLQLQFDLSTTGVAAATQASDLTLIIDADGDGLFTTGTVTNVPATSWAANTATFDNVMLPNGATFSVITKPQPLQVNAKILLQGAQSGAVMIAGLKLVLPVSDPYGLNTTPSVTPALTAAAVVDWVTVELRDATVPTTVIASRAAFVLTNGNIVDTNYAQPLYFNGVPNGNYKYVVKHRNHLGIITANAMPPSTAAGTEGLVTLDFIAATGTAVAGTNPMKINGTTRSMWAGDVDGDGVVRSAASSGSVTATSSDLSLINARGANDGGNILNIGTFNIDGVYAPEDVNMDGKIITSGIGISDATFLRNVVKDAPGNTFHLPSWMIIGQLPK